MVDVQCPGCLLITQSAELGAENWDCACGLSYVLRRCSACGVVSQVSSLQRRGQPWNCTWCQAANEGFAPRNDPAVATLSDLAADMRQRGLGFTAREPRQEPARDMQPMLIVTTNEIPGYRITGVHGDVFGLIVRARNYFSNLGAQFPIRRAGRPGGGLHGF